MASLAPADFEERLRTYLCERSEEAAAVRVGEKETSEHAAIVARYAGLFTREQHAALARRRARRARRRARAALPPSRGVRGRRHLAELAEAYDELQNAMLAARVEFRRRVAAAPLRPGEARADRRLRRRDDLGRSRSTRRRLQRRPARPHAARRGARGRPLRRNRPGARSEELKRSTCATSRPRCVDAASARELVAPLRERWLDRLLGEEREHEPACAHVAYVRRMSPLADMYTKEKAVPVCLDTLDARSASTSRRVAHPARSRRPAAEEPAGLRHRLRSARGRPPHHPRAGRAARLPGAASTRPATRSTTRAATRRFRTRSGASRATTRSPRSTRSSWSRSRASPAGTPSTSPWTRPAAEHAEATRFLEALLFRRYAAKLGYELELWSDFEHAADHSDDYAARLRPRSGSATARTTTSRIWTRASTRPTTCAPGSAPRSSARYLRTRSATTGGRRPDRRPPARALLRGHAPVERGHRGADRLRAARHVAAPLGTRGRRVTPGGKSRERVGDGPRATLRRMSSAPVRRLPRHAP